MVTALSQNTEGHQFEFLHSYLVSMRPVQETWNLILKQKQVIIYCRLQSARRKFWMFLTGKKNNILKDRCLIS